MLRKALIVIILVFVLVSIVRSPGLSADYAREGVGLLALALQRILQFFDSLWRG